MKILQLTHDWKWTGPAAPMVALAASLAERGHEVFVACPEPPDPEFSGVADQARKAGFAPALALANARGVRPVADRRDVSSLRALLAERAIDVVHTWHTRDHGLALRAARRRRRKGRTKLVRSYKSAEPIDPKPWNRWLFGPGCDGLVCVSPKVAEANRPLRAGRPVLGAFGAVDLERFRPAPPNPGVRASLGLSAEHRVVAIVARAQRHRRFELLLAAAAKAMARDEALQLLVVGRGTHIEETAKTPARELGIADRVHFAGYRTDDYVDVLRCADVFTFLVPGSDGGCRAVLEAAACGIPAVTSARGALPEIVLDGETGTIVREDADALAGAWLELTGNHARRKRMGEAARRRAETCFAPALLAETIEAFYSRL